MGQVYILCFAHNPYRHAKHYCGYVEEDTKEALLSRLERHKKGTGARLVQVITEAGITFKVAKIFKNKTRADERKFKKRGGLSRVCPICKRRK